MWPNRESGFMEKKNNFVHIAHCIYVGIFAFDYLSVSAFQKYIPESLTKQPWGLWEQKSRSLMKSLNSFHKTEHLKRKRKPNSLNTFSWKFREKRFGLIPNSSFLFTLFIIYQCFLMFMTQRKMKGIWVNWFGVIYTYWMPWNLCSRTFKVRRSNCHHKVFLNFESHVEAKRRLRFL